MASLAPRRSALPWLVSLLALGCAAGGVTEVQVVASGAGGSSGDGSSSLAGGGGFGSVEPLPIFQDPPPPAADAAPDRCDKVDFLYVIDNSQSMSEEQDRLARSFIGFSQIVDQTLGSNDHQIMVIDTDARNRIDDLNSIGQTDTDACLGVLGAGLRTGSDGQSCNIEGDQHYMLDRQQDAASTFSCLANVGILGIVQARPIDALLAATGAEPSEAEACNSGFLRDDAVLVVTIITDDDDVFSDGDPESWKQSLLQVKGGNEKAIVVLGLISDLDIEGGLPGGPCNPASGGFAAPSLYSFVSSFERGYLGSICAPDYSAFFAEAVSEIDTACRDLGLR